ncbi:MAG: OB-fold nucleic acid binding domain-containing protein, partial [Cetobacterium sp.]
IAEDTLQQPEINYPNIKEFPKNAMLNMEKEMTGLYLSGHPLDEYAHSLKMCTSVSIDKIYKSQEAQQDGVEDEFSIHDDDKVVLGGIISEVNQKVTRNNSIMAFLRFEDLTASIEVIVFPKTLDRVRNLIAADSLVVIKGRVSMKEDEPVKLICETIEPLEKVNSSKIYLRVDNLQKAKELKPSLIDISSNYKGDTPIYVFTSDDRKNYRMPREMWVNDESNLFIELREVFGEDNVKVIE